MPERGALRAGGGGLLKGAARSHPLDDGSGRVLELGQVAL